MTKKIVMELESITCPSCGKTIQDALERATGVEQVSVLIHSNRVRINYHDDVISNNQLEEIVTNLGYPVVKVRA